MTTYVYVAGIGNSGPDHWQYKWHEWHGDSGVWVEHESWDAPGRDLWVKDLDDALRSVEGPKVIIAHSLGCLVVAEWAKETNDPAVTGAFLVAVPDVDGESFPAAATGFTPLADTPLPFPAVVVASENDPYGTLGHAESAAGKLGARLLNVGRRGHINATSGLGDWQEGWSLFTDHLAH